MAETFTYKIEEIDKNNVVSTLIRYPSIIQIYDRANDTWTNTSNVTVTQLLEMIKTNDYLYCRIVQK